MGILDFINRRKPNATKEQEQISSNEAEDKIADIEAWISTLDTESLSDTKPPISCYAQRREEVHYSSEPVQGIFYILDGQIVPDYYSECLFSESYNPSPRTRARYHKQFYYNYMMKTYSGLSLDETSLPRGRIDNLDGKAMLYIDICYSENSEILEQIEKLYRLPANTVKMKSKKYTCPACR